MAPLDPRTTALVLIDLQKGILARQLGPRSGAEVVETAKGLAGRFRQAGALVVLVNVAWSGDLRDVLAQPVDQPMPRPTEGYPADFSELADGLFQLGDLQITKRQWGAFHGTELDLQLRRRGIRTIVLGGVATNMGVESTGRQAWEQGYALVLAEDATTSRSAEMHAFAIRNIFPLISQVTLAAEITLTA